MPSFRVLHPHELEFTEKHSRFIALVFPCQSQIEFQLLKRTVEQRFPHADHITYAYLFEEGGQREQRCSDAGEPSGTAGRPILSHIEGQNIRQVLVFVVRFFGGIKLGAGGLARAYGQAARLVLQQASKEEILVQTKLDLFFPYSEQAKLEYLCKKHQATIESRQFSHQLSYQIKIAEQDCQLFCQSLPSHCQWKIISET